MEKKYTWKEIRQYIKENYNLKISFIPLPWQMRRFYHAWADRMLDNAKNLSSQLEDTLDGLRELKKTNQQS